MKRYSSKLSVFRESNNLAPLVVDEVNTHSLNTTTDDSTDSSELHQSNGEKAAQESQDQMNTFIRRINEAAQQPGEALLLYLKTLDENSRKEVANQLMKELKGIANQFEPSLDRMVVHKVMSYLTVYCSPLMKKFYDSNLNFFPQVEITKIQKLSLIIPNYSDIIRMPPENTSQDFNNTPASLTPKSR